MATPTLRLVEPTVDEATLPLAPEPVIIYGLPGSGLPTALGTPGQILAVNAAGTGVEWVDAPV